MYLSSISSLMHISLNNTDILLTHYAFIWYQLNSTTSKKRLSPKTEFWKILTKNTTILERQNNIQKLQILEVLHIRMKLPKLKRIYFESSTNVLKCLKLLLLLIEMNKMLQQHTTINNKHLQSSNVHAKVTLLLQYTHPWWWPKIRQKVQG